jgi:hypothetical protein
MAAISYWFLSPSVILALIGKLKGWDRTKRSIGELPPSTS